ncbi:F-box protein At3g07870-like [Macadamia integrifolia]|uniref:F-box protein At3g07870-like n=1 Tax=Macadamia integrifolia TaxID=60698 RepID=UPI001C52DE46|nr:F-box protein At3g07870-like [Macadamia integrifolia]
MQRLPFEIIKDILSRLPVKSLMRFRFDIPFQGLWHRVEILGSCNGLLCLFVAERLPGFRHISPIYLWNPSTREYKRVPDAPVGSPRICEIGNTVLGFGYDPIKNEYKVVRIIYICERTLDSLIWKSDVRVYSLGTGKWKKLGNAPFNIRNSSSSKAIVNGSIHWLATQEINSEMSELIISFDVRNEVFREIPLPSCVEAKQHCNFVTILGGCLSLIGSFPGNYVEIWLMKDYGVNGSWTKQFTIEWSYAPYRNSIDLFPLEILKSGEILIVKNSKKLVLYDPESRGERDLGIHGLPDHFNSFIFMESLVPLSAQSRHEGHHQ